LKQAGKKEGGWGEGIFARLRFPRRRRSWGGSVSAIPLLAEYQNRKIFFSLIEKKFGGARLKKCRENFSVLLAEAKRSGGGRKRWAGFNPQNPLDFAQKRFGFRPNSTANFQFQRFGHCLPRGFAARLARYARKGLILKGFATLRAAKRKYFGFGLESSFWRSQKQNKVLPTNLFYSTKDGAQSDNFLIF